MLAIFTFLFSVSLVHIISCLDSFQIKIAFSVVISDYVPYRAQK